MVGLLGPSEGLDPAAPVEGLGLLSDVEVPGPFKKGLRVGVQNLKSIGGGIMQFAGRATGYGALEKTGQEISEAAAEESAPLSMRVEDVGEAFGQGVIPGLKTSADFVAYTIGSQIPMLATAAAGGVLGRVAAGAFGATRAMSGLSAAEKAAAVARTKAGIGSAADAAVMKATRAADIGAGLGVGAASTGMELGQIAPEGLKPENAAPLTQMAVGSLIAGATDTVIPYYLATKLGLIGAAERVLSPRKAGFGAVAGEAGKTALKTGAGEAVQETAQSYIERVSANQAITGEEANSEAINSLVAGGIIGLLTGGIAGGVQAMTRPTAVPVQETPPSTEGEQAPAVNAPVATPEEQRAVAAQQMTDLSAQVDQIRASQTAAGERLKALAEERKKDFKERRAYPLIDAERKTIQEELRKSKETLKSLESQWYAAQKVVTDLTPAVSPEGVISADAETALQSEYVAATQAAIAAGDRVAALDAEIAEKGKQAPKTLQEQRKAAVAEQKAAQAVVAELETQSYQLRQQVPEVVPEAVAVEPTIGLEPQIPGTVAEAPAAPVVAPEPTTPEMIAAVRQQLQDQGFDAGAVAGLTPEQASEALKNVDLHPVNITPSKAVENIKTTMATNPDLTPDQAHALNTLNFSELARSALDEKMKAESAERIRAEYGAPVSEFVAALPPTAADQRGGRIAEAMREDVAALVGIKIDSLTPERRAKVLPETRANLNEAMSSTVAPVVERALALPTIGAQQAALKRWVPAVLKGKVLKEDAETFAKGLAEKVGAGTLWSRGASGALKARLDFQSVNIRAVTTADGTVVGTISKGGSGFGRFTDRPGSVSYTFHPNEAGIARGMKQVTESKARDTLKSAEAALLRPAESRTATTPTGLPPAQLQFVVDKITPKWKNGPEVRVIATMADAPPAVQEHERRANAAGAKGTIRGFFSDGTVYLVASGNSSVREAVEVLYHETLGHYGLRGAFGADMIRVLQIVDRVRRDEVTAKAKKYGFDINDQQQRLWAAEEVLADLARTKPTLSVVQSAVSAIRRFLRSVGISLRYTDKDIIAQFILPARRFVERGVKAKGGAATALSRSEDQTQTPELRARRQQIVEQYRTSIAGKKVKLQAIIDKLNAVRDPQAKDAAEQNIDWNNAWEPDTRVRSVAQARAELDYLYSRLDEAKAATGNTGAFDPTNPDIRFNRAPTFSPALEATASSSGPPLVQTEASARANGFTLKAYRGVSKSQPFNKSGTVWATTSRDVADSYAKEVFGYDDADVIEVMVKPEGIPRHDIRKMTDAQREAMGADQFGNPQKIGIYANSDDSMLGSGYSHTAIHVPAENVVVIGNPAAFSRGATNQTPFTTRLATAWEKYDGTGEFTHQDLADEVESVLATEEAPKNANVLEDALRSYREDQRYDHELAGRGDMDAAESALAGVVQSFLAQEPGKPTAFSRGAGEIPVTIIERAKKYWGYTAAKWQNKQQALDAVRTYFVKQGFDDSVSTRDDGRTDADVKVQEFLNEYRPIAIDVSNPESAGMLDSRGLAQAKRIFNQRNFFPNPRELVAAQVVKDASGRVVAVRSYNPMTQTHEGAWLSKDGFFRPDMKESRAAMTQDDFDILPTPAKHAAVDEWNRIQMAKGTRIRNEITRLVGPDPALIIKTFQATPDSPVGSYTRVDKHKAVITAALNSSDNMSLAAHEGFHYAEDRLLTSAERQIVANAVKEGRPLMQALIERTQRYDRENQTNITDEVTSRPAEARAYAFQFWRLGQLQAEGPLARAFEKIRVFFERIKNLIDGLGFNSLEDIFSALDRGQFAERGGREQYGLEQTEQAFVSRGSDYTNTPEFKRWFGASKVVDKDGKPLVVYHGTTVDNEGFFMPDAGVSYFSPDPAFASRWAMSQSSMRKEQGAHVVPVYLSIQKLFDFRNPAHRKIAESWVRANAEPGVHWRTAKDLRDQIKRGYFGAIEDPELTGLMIDHGFDGFVVREAEGSDTLNYGVFRPEQIKSATGNTGAFDPTNPDIRFSEGGAQTWYRSALTDAVAAMTTKAASAQGWKDQIRGLVSAGKVKQVEIDAVGLNDWLDLNTEARPTWNIVDKKGLAIGAFDSEKAANKYVETAAESGVKYTVHYVNPARITKDQVVGFVRENGVRVEELELGEMSTQDAIHPDEVEITEPRNRDIWVARAGDQQMNVPRRDAPTAFDAQVLAAREFSRAIGREGVSRNEPKFAQWQLPGGTNYRELALYLPTAVDREKTARAIVGETAWARMHEAQRQELINSDTNPAIRGTFRVPSGHEMGGAADINRLAHIRFNERTDASGARVLFIEEIQSDWAQKGKKEGFNDGKVPEGFTVKRTDDGKQFIGSWSDGGRAVGPYATEQQVIDAAKAKKGSGIPSAPFVTKTEAWVALSLKRMIRYAAENGFDKVAWTTGEQQVSRYDLSKHLDSVGYSKRGSDLYNVTAFGKGGASVWSNQSATLQMIEDHLGKELAQKISNGEGRSGVEGGKLKYLEGLDLKVGGEGMKAFYDKIVPNVANDVLKKLGGGRVEEVRVPTLEKEQITYFKNKAGSPYGGAGTFNIHIGDQRRNAMSIDEMRRDFGNDVADRVVRDTGHDAQNDKWYSHDAYEFAGYLTQDENTPQPGFSLTPELVQRVEAGVPLFSKAGSIRATPGVDMARMAKLLGPQLYGNMSDIGPVTIKEMFQNSFDALKGAMALGRAHEALIEIDLDPTARTITLTDNGTGMTPETINKAFLTLAGTLKETDRASGGLGIAKMLFLFGNKALKLVTVRDGVESTLETSGAQLMEAFSDSSKAPNIETRKTDAPSGTTVTVEVPETYHDENDDTDKAITFPSKYDAEALLIESPLFEPIGVKINGESLAIGKAFPADQYTVMTVAKFAWGKVRVLVAETRYPPYENVSVLSNGLFQFTSKISKDPSDIWAGSAPYKFFFNLEPDVKADAPNYPISLNRKGYSQSAKNDFETLTTYINVLYANKEDEAGSSSFGELTQMAPNGTDATPINLNIPPAKKGTTLSINKDDKVEVRDGRLYVNNRIMPELTKDMLKEMKSDPTQFRVDQALLDPEKLIIHDNVLLDGKPYLEEAAKEVGAGELSGYLRGVGSIFLAVRDAVAREGGPDYANAMEVPVGVSLDTKYYGVNTSIPFKAMMVNPALVRDADPNTAALRMVSTMIHEMAHHREKNHSETGFIPELQRLAVVLAMSGDTQRIVPALQRVFEKYSNVLDYFIRTSKNGPLKNRGIRLEGDSETTGGEGVSGGVSGPGGTGRDESGLPGIRRPVAPRREGIGTGQERGGASKAALSVTPFSRSGIAPLLDSLTPAQRSLYSKAAIEATDEYNRRAAGGELTDMQVARTGAMVLENADLAENLHTRAFGVAKAGLAGGMKRWWFENIARPELVSRFSTGFRNVMMTLETYIRLRKILAQQMLREKIPSWYKASDDDRHAAFSVMLKRTVERYGRGSKELAALYDPLTDGQKKLFNEATNMIAGFLNAEFAADQVKYREWYTTPGKYEKWETARREWVADMIDKGYVPLKRYGDHTVYMYALDAKGKRISAAYQFFDNPRGAQWAAEAYKTEIERSGFNLQVEVGMRQKNMRETGMSIDQFLGNLERNGVPLQQAAKERLVEALTSADSIVRNRMMHRDNLPGYSEDSMRVIHEFGVGMASKLAYSAFGRAIDAAASGAQVTADVDYVSSIPQITIGEVHGVDEAGVRNNLWERDGPMSGFYKNISDELNNFVLVPDHSGQWSTRLRAGAMTYFIGGSISGALVNTMSIPMLTVPELSIHTNYINSVTTTMTAWKDAWRYYHILSDTEKMKDPNLTIPGIDANLKQAILAASDAIFDTEIHEMLGMSQGTVYSKSRTVQKAMEIWMKPFRISEQTNRLTAFIAAYRIASTDSNFKQINIATGELTGKTGTIQGQELFKFAHHIVNSTQNNYGESNRPKIARNPVFALMWQFKSFPMFMVEAAVLMHKASPAAARNMLLGLVLLTGVQGLPFAETLEDLIDTIAQKIFGSSFNTRKAMINVTKQASEALVGVDLSELVMWGALNAIAGVSASSRIGSGDFVPGTRLGTADADQGRILAEIAGAPYAMVKDVLTNMGGLFTTDWKDGMDAMRAGGPIAIRNLIKGGQQLYDGYASDAKGRKIMDVSTFDGLLQLGGLSPAQLAKAYQYESINIQTRAFHNKVSADMQNALVKAMRDGDVEKVQEISDLRNSWNENNPGMPILPNAAAVRRNLMLAEIPLDRRSQLLWGRRIRGENFFAEQ